MYLCFFFWFSPMNTARNPFGYCYTEPPISFFAAKKPLERFYRHKCSQASFRDLESIIFISAGTIYSSKSLRTSDGPIPAETQTKGLGFSYKREQVNAQGGVREEHRISRERVQERKEKKPLFCLIVEIVGDCFYPKRTRLIQIQGTR